MTRCKEAAQLLYGGPWVAERTAAIADLLASNPDAIDPTVRASGRAGHGHQLRSSCGTGIYRLAELKRQRGPRCGDGVDLLAFPTTGTTYRVAEVLAAPIALNSNLGAYTNFVNLLDMAAVAVPAAAAPTATGFGITLIGPADSDHSLLAAAEAYLAAADLASAAPARSGGKNGNRETRRRRRASRRTCRCTGS